MTARQVLDLPKYHEKNELSSESGYYPQLSSNQTAALNELADLIQVSNVNIEKQESDGEIHELKLLRFLRARNFNVNKAFEMMREDAVWREKMNIKSLRSQTAQEVLQCDLSEVYRLFPTWIQGFDQQARPIAWKQFGGLEISKMLKITSMDRLGEFHVWESEQAIRMMNEKSKELRCNIETFVCIIDAAGWSLRLATRDAFTFIKEMAAADSNHYPERLGKLIVINAPSVLSVAWKFISSLLNDVQRAKIKIFSARKDWLPVLLEFIDENQIPRKYGGTAPDLSSEETFQSLNPPSSSTVSSKELVENTNKNKYVERNDALMDSSDAVQGGGAKVDSGATHCDVRIPDTTLRRVYSSSDIEDMKLRDHQNKNDENSSNQEVKRSQSLVELVIDNVLSSPLAISKSLLKITSASKNHGVDDGEDDDKEEEVYDIDVDIDHNQDDKCCKNDISNDGLINSAGISLSSDVREDILRYCKRMGHQIEKMPNMNVNLAHDMDMNPKWYIDSATQTDESCIAVMRREGTIFSRQVSDGVKNDHLVHSTNCNCNIS